MEEDEGDEDVKDAEPVRAANPPGRKRKQVKDSETAPKSKAKKTSESSEVHDKEDSPRKRVVRNPKPSFYAPSDEELPGLYPSQLPFLYLISMR